MSEKIIPLAEAQTLPEGSKFSCLGLVAEIHERRDKNDKPFWVIGLMDRSGTMEAKIWSNSQWWDRRGDAKFPIVDPDQSPDVKNLKGQTVGVVGQTVEYKGKTQFTLNQIFLMDQSKEEYSPATFVRSSDASVDALIDQFRELMTACGGEAGEFLRFVFAADGENWQSFQIFPAAVTHHHAYVHGLLEHTLGVARLARSMAQSYEGTALAPDVDVVIAGACLHDLGKLDTYLLSPAPAMTLSGTVIDHVARGYARFCALAQEFGLSEPLRTHLGHILLSHHGQKEFGSPVLPATPEALIVSAADNLDFLLACWQGATERLEGGQAPDLAISDWDYSAQRRFWKWRPDAESEA